MNTSDPTQTFKTDSEQLAALRVPFPVEDVKMREQGGTSLKYYEAHVIQNRLLDVLGAGLSIRTGQVITTAENVNVETILEIEWVSGRKTITSGWGSADILRGKNDKIVNDPFKTAATDSIKVAATKLGVALELYDSNYRESIDARLKELEKLEEQKALLTCQGCGGEIKGMTRTKPDGTTIELSAIDVAKKTREKFKKRYCAECASKLSKAENPQTSDKDLPKNPSMDSPDGGANSSQNSCNPGNDDQPDY